MARSANILLEHYCFHTLYSFLREPIGRGQFGMSSNVAQPRRRRLASVLARRSACSSSERRIPPDSLSPEGLSPEDLEDAWRRLLQETLPAAKHEALMETWDAEPDIRRRYNMLLEFSSYLRQSASTDQRRATSSRANELRSKLRAGQHREEDEVSLCWEVSRVLILVVLIIGCVVGSAIYIQSALTEDEPELYEDALVSASGDEP